MTELEKFKRFVLANFYDDNGLLYSYKCRTYKQDIKYHTKFLDEYDASGAERVYCIVNDIVDVVKCPLTGKKLKYDPNKKKYLNSKEYANANRPPQKTANHKENNKIRIENFWKLYNSNQYNILEISECLQYYDGVSSQFNPSVACKHFDFSCSVIHHTRFLGENRFSIPERIYCLNNGITEIQKDIWGNVRRFKNATIGYLKHSNLNSRFKLSKDCRESHLNKDFVLGDYIDHNDGRPNYRINLTCRKCQYNFSPICVGGIWNHIECRKCNNRSVRSKIEDQILNYVKTLLPNVDILENSKILSRKLELDIYIPDMKFAIEVCGIPWHSFGTTFPNTEHKEQAQKYRHRQKYEMCNDSGVFLLTITEHEWRKKPHIVKSIIDHKLGLTKNKIYARKCVFRPIEKDIAAKFIEHNHIQGSCNFSNSFGLYHQDELVSVMAFGKRALSRGGSKFELIRFCNKLNTHVVGAASKIIKNAGVDNFISYCDLRYSDGKLYRSIGMKNIRATPPNYWYSDDKMTLKHRVNFQKHKISDHANSHMTEKEIMYAKGYRRFYDCGNLVFEYRKDK